MKIWRVYFFVALLVVPVGCKSSSELMLPRGAAVTDDGGVVILSEVAGSSQKPLRLEFYRGSSVAWERSADSFKGGMVVGAGIDVRGGMVAIVVAFWVGEKRVTRLSLYQLSNGEEPWSRVLEGSEWSKSVWGQVFVFDKAVSVVDRGSVFSRPDRRTLGAEVRFSGNSCEGITLQGGLHRPYARWGSSALRG